MSVDREQLSGISSPPHQTVENLLSHAPIADHVVHPQQPQMMAHRRLRQMQRLTQLSHIAFSGTEQQKDVRSRFPVR